MTDIYLPVHFMRAHYGLSGNAPVYNRGCTVRTRIAFAENPAPDYFTRGRYIYDFGQNFAGVTELRLRGGIPRGARVLVRHSEILSDPHSSPAGCGDVMPQQCPVAEPDGNTQFEGVAMRSSKAGAEKPGPGPGWQPGQSDGSLHNFWCGRGSVSPILLLHGLQICRHLWAT